MKKYKCPEGEQLIKDLVLIKKRTKNNPTQALMVGILYEIRNYLRVKECTDDLKAMSVSKLIALTKKTKDIGVEDEREGK